MKKIKLYITIVFLLNALCVFSNIKNVRESLMIKLNSDLKEKEKTILSTKELGEWNSIIEDTLFLLIRKTEVYRGQVKFKVYQNNEISISMFPDSSIYISSGLIEYIDEYIFLSLSDNVRRAKNINATRQEYLAQFLSFEVARFALDIDVNNFEKNPKNLRQLKDSDVFTLDEFATIFLGLAGYSITKTIDHFERIKDALLTSSYTFDKVYENIPSRLNKLKDKIEDLSEEISTFLFQINTQQGMSELLENLQALKDAYPSSLYFLRLEAIIASSIYLEQVLKEKYLNPIPLLPVAVMGNVYAHTYIELEKKLADSTLNTTQRSEIAQEHLKKALLLYEEYLERIEDDSMLSSYLALTSFSKTQETQKKSLDKALKALENEVSVIEKVNYALILSSSQTHSQKARELLETEIANLTEKRSDFALKNGIFFDERLILYNYILLLVKEKKQDKKKIAHLLETLQNKTLAKNRNNTLSIRSLKIGDSVDKMTKLWGEPSKIIYNYYFERWTYNHLKTSCIVSSYSIPPSVVTIILLPTSPVSLIGDIRVGDERGTFEKQFGKPSYRSGNYDVYLYEDKAIHIFYSTLNVICSIAVFPSF